VKTFLIAPQLRKRPQVKAPRINSQTAAKRSEQARAAVRNASSLMMRGIREVKASTPNSSVAMKMMMVSPVILLDFNLNKMINY
jgi:hypothetical protein